MKICLAGVFKNEGDMLQKTLRSYRDLFVDFIAIDNESKDNTRNVLYNYNATILDGKANDLLLIGRNRLIEEAEKAGYDAMLVVDGDESFFQEGIDNIQEALAKYDCVVLPRIEFVKDFNHFDPFLYPDFQARAFRLNKGYKWEGKVHEQLIRPGAKEIWLPNAPIFHYGKTRPLEYLYRKYKFYEQEKTVPMDQIPIDVEIKEEWYYREYRDFIGDHPLKAYAE